MNAWWEPLDFIIPATREKAGWRLEVDTYDLAAAGRSDAAQAAGQRRTVAPRSVVVLSDPQRD